MINHFTFNGTSTAQLGLIVSGVSIFGAGSRKVEKAGIPGRNGDLQIELGGFNNYTVRYTVSITKNFTTTAQQIREWLLESKGYCDLTDTYHPDEIRKACFNSDIEFTTSMLYKYGQTSIQFDCLPERYLTTNTPITTTATADTTTDTTMSLSTVPTPINISLNGNTTQEGSSGKNLLGVYSGTWTKDGVSYTVDNDGLITTSGTASASGGRFDYKSDPIILRAGTYTFKQIVISGSNNVGALLTNIDNTSTTYGASTTGNTFTLSAQVTVRLGFNVTSGTAYTSKFYLQLEKGSTATSYEPHISPTNPQPIHSVSGDNTVNVASFNVWDEISFVSSSRIQSQNYIPVLPNTAYYRKSPNNILVTYYNANKEQLSTGTWGTGLFTTPQNCYFIKFMVDPVYGTTYKHDICINVSDTQKNGTYEPYTRQSYPLYLPVENLLNLTNSTLTSYGVIFAINDGIVTAKGTTTRGSYGETDAITNGLVLLGNYGNYANVAENNSIEVTEGSYTLSADIVNNGNTQGGLFIGAGVLGARPTTFYKLTSGSYTVTATSGQRIMLAIWYEGNASATNVDLTISNIQLEKGANANHYTPYGTTPIELNKIGTYQDYIYKNGGKWYVHKEIGRYVFIGANEEGWTLTSSYTNNTRYSEAIITARTSGSALSNYFTKGTAGTDTTNIDINGSNGRIMITIPNTIASTVNDLKTWLSTHNTEVYYPLATPTNTEITDTTLINQLNNIEKAYSYDGTTNILQVSNDNGFMLEVVSLHGSTFNSNYKGEPIITVNATGLIYLNGEVMEVLSAPVTINCQTMQCYNGVVNMNNEVRVNDFPEIKIGANEVGSSMALTITPNNWRH